MFPLINYVVWLTLPEETEELARSICADALDHVTELWASVDGEPLNGLFTYRFGSPGLFPATFPDVGGLWGCPGGTYRTFQEGFWVMLEPLPPGEHTLTWGGRMVLPATPPDKDVLEQDVTYHITVE